MEDDSAKKHRLHICVFLELNMEHGGRVNSHKSNTCSDSKNRDTFTRYGAATGRHASTLNLIVSFPTHSSHSGRRACTNVVRQSISVEGNAIYFTCFVTHRDVPWSQWPRSATSLRWATAAAAGWTLLPWRRAWVLCSSPPNCRRCSCSGEV